jgi:hypothetical protein
VANQHSDRTKAKVRFWWEIYRVLLTTPTLRDALGLERNWQATLKHYQSWGDVAAMSYDEWWNSHQALFLDETASVREIMRSHFKRDSHCLYVKLNLNARVADLISEVGKLLRTKRNAFPRGKNKKQKKAILGFTQGAEIRPSAYEDYILFLKEVYAPNCRARAIELREFAQIQFRGNLKKFPSLHLDKDGTAIAYVSIKRYRDKAQQLCRAVADGKFPGSA